MPVGRPKKTPIPNSDQPSINNYFDNGNKNDDGDLTHSHHSEDGMADSNDRRRRTRRVPFETAYPFEHRDFKLPSDFEPTASPATLEAFIEYNELELAKATPVTPKFNNLSSAELQALKELRSRRDIIIKPADKGSAVVVMNLSDYVSEGQCQLVDGAFYKRVDEDLTQEHSLIVLETINDMITGGEISEKTGEYLHIKKPRTAQLYLLPKIHKPQRPPPGRLIISANECPTERISQFVDFFLQPYLPCIPTWIRDSTDFILLLEEIGLAPPGTLLGVADVNSLYTNIDHEEGVRSVEEFLEQHRPGEKFPKNSTLVKLLYHILKLNNFQFDDENYPQVGGTAMGT